MYKIIPGYYPYAIAKLSKDEVLVIITKLKSGYSTRELADEYNLHISTIRNIKNGKSWKRVTNII